jgi:ribosomal protein S18 acetylase RimI-like enzyme
VDFRLDDRLRPYVLEVNTNPDVSPSAGFAAALAAASIPFAKFVETVTENAFARLPAAAAHPHPLPLPLGEGRGEGSPSGPPSVAPAAAIRWSQPEDRDAILALLVQTGAFRPEEIAVAREVLDAALCEGPQGHYQSYTALAGERAVGWVCIGPTPCTVGTFDLYWIAIDPRTQGQGIGTALIAHAEKIAALRGGRLMVVETSGRRAYDAARRFYEKVGYEEQARLTDFYAPGDDKVVYVKRLGP